MPAEHVSWFVKTGSVEQCEEAATDFTWRLVLVRICTLASAPGFSRLQLPRML